ncbi:hypothetical protein HA49_22715 [Tatumella morbirosei]|uniref:DUF2496 domain-containing protein n=2 Tax=Erwiniaceae TaxID=1903409 RepID=A0A0F5BVG1_9GAMM|nr:hypothetical protein HA49_22715 [Tatumella morbirosei]
MRYGKPRQLPHIQVNHFFTEQVNFMSLESAPEEVKLAVDLIMLLEENQLPARLVLKALEIVRQDYLAKRDSEEQGMTPGT